MNTKFNIGYYDNCLSGPKNTNIIEDIVFDFRDQNFYTMSWRENSNKLLVLTLISNEISGELDHRSDNFKIDDLNYTELNYFCIESILNNKVNFCKFQCSEENMFLASITVRYLFDDSDWDNFWFESLRDLKK